MQLISRLEQVGFSYLSRVILSQKMSQMDTVPSRHWTPTQMDTGHCPQWILNTIPNGHNQWNGHWTRSQMNTISNERHPECTPSRTLSQMNTIPDKHLHSN